MSSDFIRHTGWDFTSDADGWTAAGGAHTLTVSGGIVSWRSNASTNIRMLGPSGQAISGAIHDRVQVRIRRVTGPTNVVLRLRYATAAGDTINAARRKDQPDTLLSGTDWVIADFDMSDLTAGGDNWRNNTITQLDLQAIDSDSTSEFEVEWIAVGRAGSTLMSAISWASVMFRPSVGQQMSGQADGVLLTQNLRPPLWQATLSSNRMGHDAYGEAQALIESMDGARLSFHVWNPARQWPLADPHGATLGASTVTIHSIGDDNHTMRLQGLPSGYVLSRGDMLSFDFGAPPRRALHRVVRAATADGDGITPMFEVYPHLRPGAAAGQVVTLVRPAMEAIITPGSYEPQAVAVRGQLTLSVIQVA